MFKILILLMLLLFSVFGNAQNLVIYHNTSTQIQTESLVFDALKPQLKEVQLSEQKVSVSRAIQRLQQGEGHCIRDLVKNKQRSEVFIFSDPLHYLFNLQLFAMPDTAAQLKQNDANLVQLLADNNKLILGIDKERSYGDSLDQQIAQVDPEQLYIKEGRAVESQLYGMLQSNRFDLLIEYPTVIDYFTKHNEKEVEKPLALPLKGLPTLISGRIACIDTAATQAFIEKINGALTTLKQSQDYLTWHLAFIDKRLHKAFKQALAEAITFEGVPHNKQ